MIPLKDNIPSRSFALVNVVIIALCTLSFLGQLADRGDGRDSLVERYGMVPLRVFNPDVPIVLTERAQVQTFFGPRIVERRRVLEEPGFTPWLTLLSCTFLHGGWLHFLGNMWFLYIFGDNVEDRLGHLGYLVFYLLAGTGASLLHLLTNPGSTVPTIGASGAIAGVMGAYMLLYPRAKVLVLVPILFILQLMVLPAALFLGLWFLLQLFQGALAITSTQAGGVAWWAHVGGFGVGAGVTFVLQGIGLLRDPPRPVVLSPGRVTRHPHGRGPLPPRPGP